MFRSVVFRFLELFSKYKTKQADKDKDSERSPANAETKDKVPPDRIRQPTVQ